MDSRLAAVVPVGLAVALAVAGCAGGGRRQALSDQDLARIQAGDLCGPFGISGPCVVSYHEVYDPSGAAATTSVHCQPGPCTAVLPPTISSPPPTRRSVAGVALTAGDGPFEVTQTYRSPAMTIEQSQTSPAVPGPANAQAARAQFLLNLRYPLNAR